MLHGGTIQPRGSKPALLNSLLSLRRPGLRRDQQVPVSSGMNIRMFPLTLDGDGGTAAASERGWVCLGVGRWGCVCVAASGTDWSDFTTRLFPGQGHGKRKVRDSEFGPSSRVPINGKR